MHGGEEERDQRRLHGRKEGLEERWRGGNEGSGEEGERVSWVMHASPPCVGQLPCRSSRRTRRRRRRVGNVSPHGREKIDHDARDAAKSQE